MRGAEEEGCLLIKQTNKWIIISFSTFTISNNPFTTDFSPKPYLRRKSDIVSFDCNLFLIEGQVKWEEELSMDHSTPTVDWASLLVEERRKSFIRFNTSNTCKSIADRNPFIESTNFNTWVLLDLVILKSAQRILY